MLHPQDITKDQRVRVTFGGHSDEAVIVLTSRNGYSLMLEFESMAGDDKEGYYAGCMPVLWDDRTKSYRDLVKSREVRLEAA